MSFYYPPWENDLEPNQVSIRQWLDNLYSKFQPIEQSRWNQSNIDTLFYAGSQTFINRYFNYTPANSMQNFYFNLLQQPVNMVTGYQRQHRKAINYLPGQGGDSSTTDQYTRLMTQVCNSQMVHEQFSRACEQSCIAGMVLLQPYLDFTGKDPAQGEIKMKLWEYNSFLVDPYFRNYDMSDAQFVWCQEYISKKEAEERFPDQKDRILPMAGTPQRYGSFYFLPENYNMARNDLLVLSYVWYRWKRKRKKLYSKSRNQFFDFQEDEGILPELLSAIPDLEVVEVTVPTWKLAVVLNDQLMYQGDNPLGFDDCPFIPVFWNYEPHNNYYDLRVRGLVRTMRDCNYLLNRRIILNHDISEATIQTGWKRKVGAVANEDNLKKSGQGWDIIVNQGYELQDIEKIQPTAVPESDFALADQLRNLIFATSGVDLENWSAQNDKQASTLTTMIKQAANLVVLQKYFDQWDLALKLVGEKLLQIVLNNWNAQKVATILQEEPTPLFYNKIFSEFQVIVEEGLLTPTQRAYQAQQLLEINSSFGREVFPPSFIVKDMNLAGKTEAVKYLQQQEMQANAIQQEASTIQQAFEQAKLQEMYAKTASAIATARERHSRSDSNIGLFEERLAEITRNHALATKDRMEALQKLVETIEKFGELETILADHQLNQMEIGEQVDEERGKMDARRTSAGNRFMAEILGGNPINRNAG